MDMSVGECNSDEDKVSHWECFGETVGLSQCTTGDTGLITENEAINQLQCPLYYDCLDCESYTTEDTMLGFIRGDMCFEVEELSDGEEYFATKCDCCNNVNPLIYDECGTQSTESAPDGSVYTDLFFDPLVGGDLCQLVEVTEQNQSELDGKEVYGTQYDCCKGTNGFIFISCSESQKIDLVDTNQGWLNDAGQCIIITLSTFTEFSSYDYEYYTNECDCKRLQNVQIFGPCESANKEQESDGKVWWEDWDGQALFCQKDDLSSVSSGETYYMTEYDCCNNENGIIKS